MSKSIESIIPTSAFSFLKSLKKNNNREWFTKNKEAFLIEQNYIERQSVKKLHVLNKYR